MDETRKNHERVARILTGWLALTLREQNAVWNRAHKVVSHNLHDSCGEARESSIRIGKSYRDFIDTYADSEKVPESDRLYLFIGILLETVAMLEWAVEEFEAVDSSVHGPH